LIPANITFYCKWLKKAEGEANVLHKTMETTETKGSNPILDKLEEMKIEPWYSHSKQVKESLRKEMETIQTIMKEAKG
jgi:tripartite-type tricarboxylate transporter receptor subunit TctC